MCESDCDEHGRREFLAKGAALIPAVIGLTAFGNPSAKTPIKPISVAPGLSIYPRTAWGSTLLPKGPLLPETSVKFLLVHHTAGATKYVASAVPSKIQQVYSFHTSAAKGWSDVCYNFFVDRFGGVWEGRQGSLTGPVMSDATGGSQGFAQLVCLLGNFDVNQPTQPMMESCAAVLAWLAGRYKVSVDQKKTVSFVSRGSNKWKIGTTVVARPISGHRDMSATACPGRYVYPMLQSALPARVVELQKFQAKKP